MKLKDVFTFPQLTKLQRIKKLKWQLKSAIYQTNLAGAICNKLDKLITDRMCVSIYPFAAEKELRSDPMQLSITTVTDRLIVIQLSGDPQKDQIRRDYFAALQKREAQRAFQNHISKELDDMVILQKKAKRTK